MKFFGKITKTQLKVTFFSPKKTDSSFFFYITDSSYEKLVALFVGSYFVNTLDQVIPRVKDADFLNTRDNLGKCLKEQLIIKHDLNLYIY